ncbi:MAG: hypothetical protein IJ692_04375 [Alloprevotella sp.]|nr:hypothetical protein [Alloprevotella sp.]
MKKQTFKKRFVAGLILLIAAVDVAWTADSMVRVGSHQDKLWLHRCTDIGKLQRNAELYPNVEVDVVLREDGRLDITHEADTSAGIVLEDILAAMKTHRGGTLCGWT